MGVDWRVLTLANSTANVVDADGRNGGVAEPEA